MRPRVILILACLLAVLAACARPEAGNSTPTAAIIRLSLADSGKSIDVPVGTEIDITLQTIGPGEYGQPQISSSAVSFLDVSYVSPAVPAGPTQLFRFISESPGIAAIRMTGTSNQKVFEITVEIK